jgi:hypothetical protein
MMHRRNVKLRETNGNIEWNNKYDETKEQDKRRMSKIKNVWGKRTMK